MKITVSMGLDCVESNPFNDDNYHQPIYMEWITILDVLMIVV